MVTSTSTSNKSQLLSYNFINYKVMSSDPNKTTSSEHKPPTFKKGWRFYIGIAALLLSIIMPVFVFFVPMLGLSTGLTVLINGLLIAGGPELVGLIAVVLLGKDLFNYFKYKAKKTLQDVVLAKSVSRTRYYVGLTINLLSWLPLYLYGYFPNLMPTGNRRIYILACADLIFIISMFIMGGEFWEKFRRIFIWEGQSRRIRNRRKQQ